MPHARPADARSCPRIGLLTYHSSVNDGSIMQAYCLYQLLQRELPEALIEIIDYMPASLHQRHWRLGLYAFRPPFFNPRYVWSHYNQKAFLRRHCRFSRERLISDDLGEAQRFIAAQGYDAVVVGSDNAWELERIPQPPNAYFRPCLGVPTFAFAPSADPAPAADSPWCSSSKAAEIKQALESFEVITVRDDGTREFLQSLGIAPSRIGYLPDPTILWDFGEHLSKQEWLGSGKRPLAALAASPKLARSIQRQLVDAGFEVVSLMGARQLDGVISPPRFSTIQQRLGLYPSFDVTITDRFHMSIFALKHGRGPVIFLEDATRWPRPNSKGRDILTRLGLQNMVLRLDEHDVSPQQLHASLAAWPNASRGLAERIAALREKAEATSFSGIATTLKAIVAKGAA
jgi:polysaccharide pyruvyl transferase WcaK-like protein